jgi:hypothetical protein
MSASPSPAATGPPAGVSPSASGPPAGAASGATGPPSGAGSSAGGSPAGAGGGGPPSSPPIQLPPLEQSTKALIEANKRVNIGSYLIG